MRSLADLISTTVTDKFVHGTTFTYDILLEGIDEFLRAVHRKDVNDVGVATDEDLGTSVTVDSGDLGYDCVGSNWFMTAEDVEHGEWGLVGVTDCRAKLRATSCVLGGILVSEELNRGW